MGQCQGHEAWLKNARITVKLVGLGEKKKFVPLNWIVFKMSFAQK